MQQIPVIETDRLILRPHRAADFAACVAMWADPAVFRYIGGNPAAAEATWSRLLRYAGMWKWLGFGYWAVQDKASGLLAGELGFADFKRDMNPALGGTPESGWVFASEFHGRGYATEALTAALKWGDGQLPSARTVCLISPDNRASIRVAEKCGYRKAGTGSYKGEPVLILERNKEQGTLYSPELCGTVYHGPSR